MNNSNFGVDDIKNFFGMFDKPTATKINNTNNCVPMKQLRDSLLDKIKNEFSKIATNIKPDSTPVSSAMTGTLRGRRNARVVVVGDRNELEIIATVSSVNSLDEKVKEPVISIESFDVVKFFKKVRSFQTC